MPRSVGPQDLRAALPMVEAIDSLEAAWRDGMPASPARQHVDVAMGDLLLMPAAGGVGVGVKLVTVAPENPRIGAPLIQGVYVLFDPSSLSPIAIFDGAALTALRTAAVSGVATRYLARPDARHLVIFGSGVQARAHIEAMLAVRPLSLVTIVTRNPTAGAELAAELTGAVEIVTGSPESISDADIVCCCTTSSEPLFEGDALSPGVHVNAIGSYKPDRREVDSATVRRAKIVVETRAAAMAEAGDIAIPLQAGEITEQDLLADLEELVRGRIVRTRPDDVTLFKSVGMATEDLVIAAAAAAKLS